MEYSATCDVLIVQVIYKLRNTLVQCHVQNAFKILWLSVFAGFMSFKLPHDISVDTAFQILKYKNRL
jgi:hypothetical protein